MTEYVVKEAKSEIVNTQDNDQGIDSPRWTPEFPEEATVQTIHEYAEWDVRAWGPSGEYQFEVLKDDLVTKYWEPVEAEDWD